MDNNKLNQVLDALIDVIKNTTDFAKGELPEIAGQAIRLKVTHSLIWFSFGLVALGALYLLWRKGKDTIEMPDDQIGFTVGIGIGFFTILTYCFYNLNGFLGAVIAPKVFLLEYFTDIIKRFH